MEHKFIPETAKTGIDQYNVSCGMEKYVMCLLIALCEVENVPRSHFKVILMAHRKLETREELKGTHSLIH